MTDDELSTRALVRVGTTLKGKYRIDHVLGVGGMAAVYAATHRNRNRVAVKVLHPELAVDSSLRSRFMREGYVANTVEHPGTVRVLDDDVDEDGSVFLVMELLEGETLSTRWERWGCRLGAKEVATLMRDLLDVLSAAHSKGIVHRDVKPENLFLTRDGTLKVLDFGIARLREASPAATRSGHVFGTPAFMPPEQALGRLREVDALSDVWAVGATAFTLLSGQLVHAGQTAEEMMVYAATTPARRIASLSADVPPGLAEVVDRALAFEKRDRWSSARAMQEALSRLLKDWPEEPERVSEDPDDEKTKIAAPPQMTMRGDVDVTLPLPKAQASETLPMPTLPVSSTIAGVASHSVARRIRSRYAVAAAGGVAAALLIVGAVYLVAARASTTRPSPAPSTSESLSTIVTTPTTRASLSATSGASATLETVPVEALPLAASAAPVESLPPSLPTAPGIAPPPASSVRATQTQPVKAPTPTATATTTATTTRKRRDPLAP